jgi:hypothetical protein
MPNYCYNRLEIDGADDELDALAKAVAIEGSDDPNDRFSYGQVIPIPVGSERDEDDDEETFWGTTSLYCLEVKREQGELIYEFESSWNPPEQVVAMLSLRWPDLRFNFTYCEPLTGRYGFRHLRNGGKSGCWSDGATLWWDGGDSGEMRNFLESYWPQLAAKWWSKDEGEDEEEAAA